MGSVISPRAGGRSIPVAMHKHSMKTQTQTQVTVVHNSPTKDPEIPYIGVDVRDNQVVLITRRTSGSLYGIALTDSENPACKFRLGNEITCSASFIKPFSGKITIEQ